MALAVAAGVPFWGYVFFAPISPPGERTIAAGSVFLGADGTVLQRDTAAGIRIPVPLEGVAPILVDATIAAEDSRYADHIGIDAIAVGRAISAFRSSPSGASTITQQVARRLYVHDDSPSPWRKAREALVALRLEQHASKDEILGAYLNDIYYGRGAYGIEAAARVYFGVSARDLNLARAAMLAGLPQSPEKLDPDANAAAAKARQAYVLRRLREEGRITSAEEAAALAEPLGLLPALEAPIAPHFVQWAQDELRRLLHGRADEAGLVIETTLDAGLQLEAERSIRARLAELKERDVTNAAAVVIDPRSGAVLAMAGSASFDDQANGGQNNLTLALRQPGSALKPFLYAAAFEEGYTAAAQLLDVATTFESNGAAYTPGNYDRLFHGPVSLRVALASSFNVPAVQTLEQIGIDRFMEVTQRFGLTTMTEAERYGLALTLGGGEVRLVDLAAAYGALADGGLLRQPYAIERVLDARGRVIFERAPAPARRAISAEHAWIISDILRDPDARAPGFGASTVLTASTAAAVKTGTTTGFRDNWAIGYTPARVVGVWVGNADGRAMDNVSGIDGAGPIWRDLIEAAAADAPAAWPPAPSGLVRATVCSPTGLLPGPACPSPRPEWFVRGTEPAREESYYQWTADGTLAVDPPPAARAWAADAGLVLAQNAPARPALQIVQPAPGAVLFLAAELGESRVILRASAAGAVALEFRVNGQLAGVTGGDDGVLPWRLEAGRNQLLVTATLADGTTVSATSTYEVRNR
jgi:penicillin-binding protein 1C